MASGDNGAKKLKCRPKNPCILIRKLTELMEHPITENATERHLEILNDYLEVTHYAFWLQDIPYIIRLYECIVKKLDTSPEFKQPLEYLLYFSAVPPMMIKSCSDKVTYERDLQEYFSVLGYLILCLHDNNLKILVLNALKGLLQPNTPVGYCCVPLECLQEAAEKSRLPETLAQLIQIIDDELYPLLLDVTFVTSQKMIAEDAIEFLIQRFEPTWNKRNLDTKPSRPTEKDNIVGFEDSCGILWNLLSSVNNEEEKKPSASALWSLQYALRWSVICPGQKANRNNITALILKLLTTFPSLNIGENELSDELIILASAAAGCNCTSPLEFTNNELDFQFKKIIWSCLYFCRPCEMIGENDILKAFMKTLFQANHNEELNELSLILLKLIPQYFKCSVNIFVQLGGHLKVVTLLKEYVVKNYNTEILDAYILCLWKIMLEASIDIIQAIAAQDIANTIILICKEMLKSTTMKAIYQKILAHNFSILQILCINELFDNEEVVDITIDYLNRVIKPNKSDPILDARVTICVIHLLWECLLASKSLHREFLKKGGIYVMLDIIKISPFPVKMLSLGLLADCAQKPSSVPYFITWRKQGYGLMSMLLDVFKTKNKELCDESCNKNAWMSLCQKKKQFHICCLTGEELLERCRSRIHGILQAVRVKFREKVAIANERYQVFNENLNTDNELTLLFASNFIALRICENWLVINKELKNEKIIPVEIDDKELKGKITEIRQWKSFLQCTINHIIKKEARSNLYNETMAYVALKESKLSDALDALRELRYICNCTERMFQIGRKLMLHYGADLTSVEYSHFHRTMNEMPFTNIYNQMISIQSNIIYEKQAEKCPISPVSSEYESVEFNENEYEHPLTEPSPEC